MSDGDAAVADDLDYLRMLKEARKIGDIKTAKTLRMALMGDFATQQLVSLLKVLCARRGVKLEIYEAGYDSIDFEILDKNSGLYAFDPHYIAIMLSGRKLSDKLTKLENRQSFAEETIGRLTNLWGVLAQQSKATVIQSNFVIPSERAFGHYELTVSESIGAVAADINGRMAAAVRRSSNVLLCDMDFLAGEIGRRQWFDEGLWSMAKAFCRLDNLPHVAKAVCDVMLAASGQFVKCVVLDLDNTLWGGVIGDDGLNGIALGDYDEGESFVAFQRFLLELKRRGIILAVVSKNEHANAVLPFREHPNMVLKESDIAVFVANWDNKADNIRLVQKTLNIGFDSMVFIDDNPFERNIVRQYLPEVIVPEMPGEDPALYIRTLADLNLFETASFSEADKQRADQYREEAQRELVKSNFTNVNDYLISLDMKIKLERFNRNDLARIAQLMQRSNQFNLMTRRYSEAVCEALIDDPASAPLTLKLSDKYGDYGLISVIIVKIAESALLIDEYLMSCRVLMRGVEHYAMNRIVAFARSKGLKAVQGHYRRTAKNDMVKDFFARFGFEKTAEHENGDSDWSLSVDRYQPLDALMTPVIDEL